MRPSILVPLDGSVASECAVPAAAMLARLAGARLTLVWFRSAEASSPAGTSPHQPGDSEAGEYLAGIVRSLDKQGVEIDAQVDWARSAPEMADAIVRRSIAQASDLIVMNAGVRRGWSQRVQPSIAEQVVAGGTVPVMLTRPDSVMPGLEPGATDTALFVMVDGSSADNRVVSLSKDLAHLWRAKVVLLFSVSPIAVSDTAFYTHRLIDDVLSNQRDQALADLARLAAPLKQDGLIVDTRVRIGTPVELVLDELKKQSLAVVVRAAERLSLLQRAVVGSAAEQILCEGGCPVLLVNGDRERIPAAVPRTRDLVLHVNSRRVGLKSRRAA